METNKPTTPLAFKVALINLAVGGAALIASIALTSMTSGYSQLSSGVLLLGIGEFLNNPTYSHPASGEQKTAPLSFWQRRRSVCGLGNLFDIAGVIMIAIGAATLLFR